MLHKFDIVQRPWYTALFEFSTEDTAAFKENKDPMRKKILSEQPSHDQKLGHDSGDDGTLLPRVSVKNSAFDVISL